MAQMLAHEIKNPLSGIRGASQLLESAVDGDDRALTRLICDETDRICALVDQMDVFTDERPLASGPVNIHDVLDHVKKIARNGFGQGIQISEDYDPSLPPVPGDRDLLIQVFLNLIKNACEAIEGTPNLDPAKRRIIIRSEQRGDEAVVTIDDFGPGIPDAVLPRIFAPDVTTKKSGLNFGLGLGLSIVRRFVTDYGGDITAHTTDHGARFTVTLPTGVN